MAFFDDLGKKISHAGHVAVQKTKDITDIARLNTAISDNDKKINALYAEIGKAYYERCKADPEAEEREHIQEITVCLEQIIEYREQIKQLKGMTKCPKCGADVPNAALFCSVCGTKTAGGVLCRYCGAPVAEDMAFCSACGKRLSELENEAPGETCYCSQCGGIMEKGDPFCPACGARTDANGGGRQCPACGAPVTDGDSFCPECGAYIHK